MFFKTKSVRIKVVKNDKVNIKTNFLSCLVIPGFFLSSKIKTISITNNQIKIKLPFREKKEKKLLKNKLWGIKLLKKLLKKLSKEMILSIVNIIIDIS